MTDPEVGDLVPVCALCRGPLAAGMRVTLYDANDLRRRCALLEIRLPVDDPTDEEPIVVCLPCNVRLQPTSTRMM